MKRIRNVSIVSLSSGIIGEESVRHEVDIGLGRLREMGLSVKFMPNALRGLEYVRDHPEKRAEDLLAAFRDPDTDMILCAIGGDDTYRLLPYLFENGELADAVTDKVFLGFSDTTINHFMLHRTGLDTFYGQSFLADICEIGPDMLPYSRRYFEELIRTGTIREIVPSKYWYRERKDFGTSQVGTETEPLPDTGFELLQGDPVFSGRILGGCIDSIYDKFSGETYADMPLLCRKYGLFPEPCDWEGRILLLESSEEKMSPEKYGKALRFMEDAGVFNAVSGILAGKPMDRTYEREYKEMLREFTGPYGMPVVCNINIGHSQPRCIIPFGREAVVDAAGQTIRFAPR